MHRRTFITATAALAAPRLARAQRTDKVARVGFLYVGSRESAIDTGRLPAFESGLRALGYVDGKNLAIDAHFGEGRNDRLAAGAASLIAAKVDVIVATGSPAYTALRHAASTIPVVATVTPDPVIEGLAATLNRPGGNFTGFTDTASDLGPKQLELVRTLVPNASRVGALLNP